MTISLMQVFTTFTLIGIMVFSLLSFGVSIQENNGVTDNILNDEFMNRTFSGLETNLSAFKAEAQGQRENFEGEVPERGFGTLLIFSIVTVGQKFVAMIVAIFNILTVLPAQSLGIPKSIIGSLEGILLVSLILLVWRVI